MVPHRYVRQIPGLTPAELYPDTWMAERPRGLGTYLISSHKSGSVWKPHLLRTFRRFERESGGNPWTAVGRNRDWHLHHIVELRHCADLDVSGRLEEGRDGDFARFQAPCVLLSWEEHNHYTFATLGAGETPLLFLTEDPYARVVERSRQARADAATSQGRAKLRRRARRFRELYENAYSPEPVLQAVALRVLGHLEEEVLALG